MQSYEELILLAEDGRISVPLPVSFCRVQGKKVVVGFAGISSRNQLDDLLGAMVLVDKKALPEIAEDQFYWCDYIGRAVATERGQQLGRVKALFNNGAQDVLVLQQQGVKEEILVPITGETVVDDSEGKLIVNLPPGLLEINSPAETGDDI